MARVENSELQNPVRKMVQRNRMETNYVVALHFSEVFEKCNHRPVRDPFNFFAILYCLLVVRAEGFNLPVICFPALRRIDSASMAGKVEEDRVPAFDVLVLDEVGSERIEDLLAFGLCVR